MTEPFKVIKPEGEGSNPKTEGEENPKASLKPESESSPKPESNGIAKPGTFNLDKFKSKHAAAIANVGTLLTALPVHNIAAAKDFVQLHPDKEKYWSAELCFVPVPIKGQKRDTSHLIVEDIALKYLPSGRILRSSLALATKPNDRFFLCEIPTQNQDNPWNASNILACEQARSLWTVASSRKDEGVDAYKVEFARDQDAFPEPKWPTQSLEELIGTAFAGRIIDHNEHPALLRLIGAKQQP